MAAIPTFFPTEFATSWEPLLGQRDTYLLPYVTRSDFKGKKKWWNQTGTASMQPVLNRKQTTRDGEFSGSKYWMTQNPYDCVTTFDEFDEHYLGSIVLPTSEEVAEHAVAANKKIDDIIVAAFDATRYIGEDGTTTDAFPAGQSIAKDYVESGSTANSGLTIGKLRRAKYLMDISEVPKSDRFIAAGAQQVQDLLRTTEVTSHDYNTVKALASGDIDTFLGFKFVDSQRLTEDTSTDVRSVIAWHKSAIKFAMGERKVHMDILETKSHALQIRTVMMAGAVRTENERVVRIYCDESP